jgi:ABC-2 type transport system permease protein
MPTVDAARRRPGAGGWRAFSTAAWLGWQIESNWARPGVFAIYSVIKPLALAGILVVMYAVVTRDAFNSPVFTYMYVGNAFYIYVGAVMTGMAFAVVQDREHYRTLKLVCAAPLDVRLYLIGRGVARFVVASVSVVLTLAAGVAVLGIGVNLRTADWPLFAVAMTLGVGMLACMGLGMAGLMLLAGRDAWGTAELLSGALYLFSGAIFPLDVLPAVLQPFGRAIPTTYWLDLIRRALAQDTRPAAADIATWTNADLLAMLAALTAAYAAAAIIVFHVCGAIARRRGAFDRTSNF